MLLAHYISISGKIIAYYTALLYFLGLISIIEGRADKDFKGYLINAVNY
jgi:hypothetical protein